MFSKIKKDIRWKKRWKKGMRNVNQYGYEHSWMALCQSLEDLLDESFDYMFIPEVERICYELIETIANLKYMLETNNEEEYNMLKHRVIYLIENRMEEWYI